MGSDTPNSNATSNKVTWSKYAFLYNISKEKQSGGTVDWAQKLQTTNLFGLFLAASRLLDTLKRNFYFMQWKFSNLSCYIRSNVHSIEAQSTIPPLRSSLNISMTAVTLIRKKEVLWLKVPQPHQLLTADFPFFSVWHFELTSDNRLVFQFLCQSKTLLMKIEICLEFKQCWIFFKDSNNFHQSKDWKTIPMTNLWLAIHWRCRNEYPNHIRFYI